MNENEKQTEEIRKWWDANPFTFGASGTAKTGDQVGRIPVEKMDLKYFEEIERKFRKHSRSGGQEDGEPLLSKLVDYNLISNKKVLDIAVGSGFSLVSFAKEGGEVTGIDLTDFAVLEAKRNLELRGLKGEVFRMDAQNLEFENNTYDFVNSWGCLMHMPNTEKAISEIYRVLKDNGQTLSYMYNKSSWPFWFNIIFLRGILLLKLLYYKFDIDRLTSRYSDGYTSGGNRLTKFYSPRQVQEMYQKVGFKKVTVFPWQLPDEPDNWPLRSFPVFKYLPKFMKNFMSKRWGYGLIVKAQK